MRDVHQDMERSKRTVAALVAAGIMALGGIAAASEGGDDPELEACETPVDPGGEGTGEETTGDEGSEDEATGEETTGEEGDEGTVGENGSGAGSDTTVPEETEVTEPEDTGDTEVTEPEDTGGECVEESAGDETTGADAESEEGDGERKQNHGFFVSQAAKECHAKVEAGEFDNHGACVREVAHSDEGKPEHAGGPDAADDEDGHGRPAHAGSKRQGPKG